MSRLHPIWLVALVFVCLAATGCPSGNAPPAKQTPGVAQAVKSEPTAPAANDDEDGWLFDAKEEYHLLLKVDATKKEARARVLDEIAKEDVPLKADALTLTIKNGKPLQFELKAQRKPGRKDTAFFVGTNDRLADKLDPAKVEISTDIKGKNYIFTLDTDHKEKRGKNK